MIEHPDRRALHNEVHARPPEPMQAPMAISHVVMLADAAARDATSTELRVGNFRDKGRDASRAGRRGGRPGRAPCAGGGGA